MDPIAPGDRPQSEVTRSIIQSAMHVQNALGIGLYENPYKICLAHDLRRKGHAVQAEVHLDLQFEGLWIPDSCRIDLLIDDAVIVEAKAVDRLTPMHQSQVLTYLRLAKKEVGLLLNFWAYPLKANGIQRLILSSHQHRA
jgi:GxxExxY protein